MSGEYQDDKNKFLQTLEFLDNNCVYQRTPSHKELENLNDPKLLDCQTAPLLIENLKYTIIDVKYS